MTGTYVWPKHESNGKPIPLGDMTPRQRVAAEGFVHQSRRQMDLTTIIVKSFLERQAAIAAENLALGLDIG